MALPLYRAARRAQLRALAADTKSWPHGHKDGFDAAVTILFWDRGGLVLYYKRLERGRFRAPRLTSDGRAIEMDATELAMLLDGIDVKRVRRAQHWQPPASKSA